MDQKLGCCKRSILSGIKPTSTKIERDYTLFDHRERVEKRMLDAQ